MQALEFKMEVETASEKSVPARKHLQSNVKTKHLFADICDNGLMYPSVEWQEEGLEEVLCLTCPGVCEWVSGENRITENVYSVGLPCTPFSTLRPKRWNAAPMGSGNWWWEGPLKGMVKHMKLTHPEWVILENVAEGMLKRKSGSESNDLKRITDHIQEQCPEYKHFAIHEMCASEMCPMRRKRIYVVFTRLGAQALAESTKFIERVRKRYRKQKTPDLTDYMEEENEELRDHLKKMEAERDASI
jgi:site-specific DNA-cytosine methylase